MKYLKKIKVNKLRKLVYEKNVEEKEKNGYLLKEAPLKAQAQTIAGQRSDSKCRINPTWLIPEFFTASST